MRKRIISRFTVYVWMLLLAACQQTATQQEQAATAEEAGYQVIAIKDGDTIEILKDGKPVRIRLYGIDAPEKNQDFGTRSQQFISSLVFGKRVELNEKGSDRYGRVVGILYLPDGRSVNEEMVSAGFAWHYKAYSKDPRLAELEAGARMARRGLWAGPTPTAPWEFRKSRRSKNQPSAAGETRENKKEIKVVKPGLATGTVFLCDSKGAATFHQDRQCRQLKNCKADIKAVSRQAAGRQYQRKACRVCAS